MSPRLRRESPVRGRPGSPRARPRSYRPVEEGTRPQRRCSEGGCQRGRLGRPSPPGAEGRAPRHSWLPSGVDERPYSAWCDPAHLTGQSSSGSNGDGGRGGQTGDTSRHGRVDSGRLCSSYAASLEGTGSGPSRQCSRSLRRSWMTWHACGRGRSRSPLPWSNFLLRVRCGPAASTGRRRSTRRRRSEAHAAGRDPRRAHGGGEAPEAGRATIKRIDEFARANEAVHDATARRERAHAAVTAARDQLGAARAESATLVVAAGVLAARVRVAPRVADAGKVDPGARIVAELDEWGARARAAPVRRAQHVDDGNANGFSSRRTRSEYGSWVTRSAPSASRSSAGASRSQS